MKKVLFVTNLPVPYKVDFFNLLSEKVKLTVLFERKTAKNRNSQWLSSKTIKFNHIFLKGIYIGVESSLSMQIIKLINKNRYDAIIIGAYYTPTALLAILYMKMRNIPYYISTDGGFKKDDKFLHKKVKTFFLKNAKGYFSPNSISDEYLVYYGASEKKIIRYPFTSLLSEDIISNTIANESKEHYKRIIGFKKKYLVLGVGQIIPRKGWDLLIKSAEFLSDDVGIIIIGGKNDIKLSLPKNVEILDFVDKSTLEKYYLAADIFVLPTREDIWGLVINEAMGKGLPVITTDRCGAGLELVKDGGNGYIIKHDDYTSLQDSITLLLENEDLRNRYSIESLKRIKNYTLEHMAEVFYQNIN
ncbi:glycosyltransferase family 4 protein [Enterococcus cecorum]|uniref:glycosyltransferase family 4 protein n=1 Tax=Enterococcus cecorum TaxID=44008 RepID=UPI00148D4726|nr:glycosyltransferase family 4 protein [Enterococcus cecorum]